jgi:hypothetical protein
VESSPRSSCRHGWLGSGCDHVADSGQGGLEKGRAVIVGAGGEQMQRDPAAVAGHGAFGSLVAPVNSGCGRTPVLHRRVIS